jgi:hypothetical protein
MKNEKRKMNSEKPALFTVHFPFFTQHSDATRKRKRRMLFGLALRFGLR